MHDTNINPHLHRLTNVNLRYQSLNYHMYCSVYQVSGIYAVILYYFKCFYGIKFQYDILRVVSPCPILISFVSNSDGR